MNLPVLFPVLPHPEKHRCFWFQVSGGLGKVAVGEECELSPTVADRCVTEPQATSLGDAPEDSGNRGTVVSSTQYSAVFCFGFVQRANGSKYRAWTTKRTMDLGKGKVHHSFLVIPECPASLMGRDLLMDFRARITFNPEGPQMEFLNPSVKTPIVMALTMPVEDEHQLFTPPKTDQTGKLSQKWITDYPDAWAETAGLGLAVKQPPITVELKTLASPINIKQYPLSKKKKKKKTKDGIRPHIQKYLALGVLRPCQSAWNTPLLPVKKPGTGDYHPVQDLREINNRVQDIHPTVPNPYNLLSTLNPERKWYTVLDLKDAFFCLPLHKDSQLLFAFKWVNPETGTSGQLTWTRLPQGFKNSPTLFDEALHRDLNNFRITHPEVTLLQYVDDLLLAADTKENCESGTQALLSELAQLEYKASAKKGPNLPARSNLPGLFP
nr:LOW QUALITY PROTEIN: uncharacterized protein LOC114082559 [Marmota flaviventris]